MQDLDRLASAAPAGAGVVLKRFAVPLPAHPGWVARYTLHVVDGRHQLQWDGMARADARGMNGIARDRRITID